MGHVIAVERHHVAKDVCARSSVCQGSDIKKTERLQLLKAIAEQRETLAPHVLLGKDDLCVHRISVQIGTTHSG